MKRAVATILGLIAGLTLLASSVQASPPNPTPGPPDLERAVFVHLPKAAEAKGGGGLSVTNCPNADTCTNYKYSGVHWASGSTVTYTLDATNSPVNVTASESVFATSFAQWNYWSLQDSDASSFLATYQGQTPGAGNTAGVSMDGVNSLSWQDISASYPNAIAVTFVWYSRATKLISEVDTVFNIGPGFTWAVSGTCGAPCLNGQDPTPASSTAYDVENIATHEFGHWLMLGDLYSSRDNLLTMYGYSGTGETNKDSLGLGDKLGVQKAY
ncbi:MAG: hypothetical protein HYX89_08235 [Chloroflexi bacterium]|nr:hypothetical protein [Chloroflexota bacterium]